MSSAKLHETVADDFVLDLQVYGRRKAQSPYSLLPPHTLSKFPLFFLCGGTDGIPGAIVSDLI